MKSIPLLAFPVAAYNLLAFLFAGLLDAVLWEFTLMSGGKMAFSVSDLLVALSVIILYIEILKATRTSGASIVDHVFSLLLFVICLVEFILVPQMAKSAFLILMLISFLDVIAGFTITISTARRDIGLGEQTHL